MCVPISWKFCWGPRLQVLSVRGKNNKPVDRANDQNSKPVSSCDDALTLGTPCPWVLPRVKPYKIEGLIIRESLVVLRMSSCVVKLDEKKSKHAGLAQQTGFVTAQFHYRLWLVKGAATKLCELLEKSVINMI